MKNIYIIMNYIELSHISNSKNFYKVGVNSANKTNLKLKETNVIQSGSEEALIFIVKYLNCYENDNEISPPEQPLIENIELKDLFEFEEHIFENLMDFAKIHLLSNIIKIAEELNMKMLLQKLAAIIAYNMQNKLK
jgi:hypothetical protein